MNAWKTGSRGQTTTPLLPMASRSLSRRALCSRTLLAGMAALVTVSAPPVAVVDAAASFGQAAAQPQAPGSLAEAVRAAEQRTGGRAKEVEMERERGVEVYEVKTVSTDGPATVVVEPASGNILDVEGRGALSSLSNLFESEDRDEHRTALARLEAAGMTLAAAIELAEKETGGRAVQAAAKRQYGATVFEVRLVRDLMLQKVLVDPGTNRVVTVPRRDRDDD